MSVLRVNKIAASGQTSENTGSVYFDGSGDYLEIADTDDLTFGSGDYTIEAWIYIEDGTQEYQGIFGSSGTGSCLLYTSPSPRDVEESRMPSSA